MESKISKSVNEIWLANRLAQGESLEPTSLEVQAPKSNASNGPCRASWMLSGETVVVARKRDLNIRVLLVYNTFIIFLIFFSYIEYFECDNLEYLIIRIFFGFPG